MRPTGNDPTLVPPAPSPPQNAATCGPRATSGATRRRGHFNLALAPSLGFRTIDPCTGKERWATSPEHEFLASKTTGPTARRRIHNAATPKQARSLGAVVKLRMAPQSWDFEEAEAALHEANSKKFRHSPDGTGPTRFQGR